MNRKNLPERVELSWEELYNVMEEYRNSGPELRCAIEKLCRLGNSGADGLLEEQIEKMVEWIMEMHLGHLFPGECPNCFEMDSYSSTEVEGEIISECSACGYTRRVLKKVG